MKVYYCMCVLNELGFLCEESERENPGGLQRVVRSWGIYLECCGSKRGGCMCAYIKSDEICTLECCGVGGMCVYVYVYMCICVYVYMCIYVCVCMYIYVTIE